MFFQKNKIRVVIVFICLLFQSILSFAQEEFFFPEDEILAIEKVIELGERQLFLEKELKNLLLEFKVKKERLIAGDESKRLVVSLSKLADQILDCISSSHLEHLFSSDYLEELALFSSVIIRK